VEYIEFEKEFNELISKYNIKSNNITKQLYTYMECILESNNNINLTSITNPNEFIVKHFIDSLIISEYIDGNKILDIGTGAGFPGIPLAINNPDKNFVLLDSVNKKLNVIRGTLPKININNVDVIHSRAEDLAHNIEYREQFDCVVSRAVANLTTLVEYMLPFAKVGGMIICLKGPNYEQELMDASKAIDILGGKVEKTLSFNIEDNERNIIFIKKHKTTPEKFPRKQGKPLKEPIK
jgi:16S rRNA (guanine527-N7)-methyltransferase